MSDRIHVLLLLLLLHRVYNEYECRYIQQSAVSSHLHVLYPATCKIFCWWGAILLVQHSTATKPKQNELYYIYIPSVDGVGCCCWCCVWIERSKCYVSPLLIACYCFRFSWVVRIHSRSRFFLKLKLLDICPCGCALGVYKPDLAWRRRPSLNRQIFWSDKISSIF